MKKTTTKKPTQICVFDINAKQATCAILNVPRDGERAQSTCSPHGFKKTVLCLFFIIGLWHQKSYFELSSI